MPHALHKEQEQKGTMHATGAMHTNMAANYHATHIDHRQVLCAAETAQNAN